jgi:2-polyprenyl-6-methoxyphenol hydroxylase-like FAD-dependent oxidoreductase
MAAMLRIALIGGGIGGLAAAIALRQCGFEPVVFEQANCIRDGRASSALCASTGSRNQGRIC